MTKPPKVPIDISHGKFDPGQIAEAVDKAKRTIVGFETSICGKFYHDIYYDPDYILMTPAVFFETLEHRWSETYINRWGNKDELWTFMGLPMVTVQLKTSISIREWVRVI